MASTNTWDAFPANYRQAEAQAIFNAARAGDCVNLVGLSGAGKSNLLTFLAQRHDTAGPRDPRFFLIDCNRLDASNPAALFRHVRHILDHDTLAAPRLNDVGELDALELLLEKDLANRQSICLLIDRFDALLGQPEWLFNNMRALRDAFKYRLTYVLATRRPLPDDTELAELFFANTLWLGPLAANDARWSVARFVERQGLAWESHQVEAIINLSGGYPSFLRAICEAHAAGTPLELSELLCAAPVEARLAEFWGAQPDEYELRKSRLAGVPLLAASRRKQVAEGLAAGELDPDDPTQLHLTAKERRLLDALRAHPNRVIEKDELIRAVWVEDRYFEAGIRDDSLAQLVRRLREKIERDPSNPQRIRTVAGRGYTYYP